MKKKPTLSIICHWIATKLILSNIGGWNCQLSCSIWYTYDYLITSKCTIRRKIIIIGHSNNNNNNEKTKTFQNRWYKILETERHKRSCQIRIKQPFALTQLSLLQAVMQPRKSWTIIVENNCISHTDQKIQLAIYRHWPTHMETTVTAVFGHNKLCTHWHEAHCVIRARSFINTMAT